MARPLKDITEQEFGRLRVLRPDPRKTARTMWICLCDPLLGGCGNETSTRSERLLSGRTTSCGCRRMEWLAETTHGHTVGGRPTKEFTAWAGMLDRCYRENAEQFRHYGGRGITVCDRWRESFENFLSDMGSKPTPKHSIDRYPDTNGNYEPSNCRWATSSEQMRNTRVTRMVSVGGETKSAADWGDETGVKHKTIIDRIDHGFSAEDAISLGRYGMRGRDRYEHNGESKTLAEWSAALSIPLDRLHKRLRDGWPLASVFAPVVPGKRARSTIPAKRRVERPSMGAHDLVALRLGQPSVEALALLSISPRQTAEHNGASYVGGMVALALVRRGLAEFLTSGGRGDPPAVALTALGSDLVTALVTLESAPASVHRTIRKNMGLPMSERLRVHKEHRAVDADAAKSEVP